MVKTNITENRTKILAYATVFLLISCFAPLCLASEGLGETVSDGRYSEVPGVPDNAIQYNKTDVTPVAEMEQVAAGEPALFLYRNMTMLMNCSRNCEVVFTADPEVTPKTFGLSIEPNQTMTLTMNMYRSPLKGEQTMEGALNFYLGIEPDAEVQLQAQLRLLINHTELNQELNKVVNTSRLTWMYWNQTRSQWETVESHMDKNGYLVCNNDHFSLWTVAELEESTEDRISSEIPIEYISIGTVAIAAVVVIVGVFVYKKRK
jgi:hypothetical protein